MKLRLIVLFALGFQLAMAQQAQEIIQLPKLSVQVMYDSLQGSEILYYGEGTIQNEQGSWLRVKTWESPFPEIEIEIAEFFTQAIGEKLPVNLLKRKVSGVNPRFIVKSTQHGGLWRHHLLIDPVLVNDAGQAVVDRLQVIAKPKIAGQPSKIARQTASQSVLDEGEWYKLPITSTGIYKLDRNFLSNLGIEVDNLDPRTIQIYGNGGGMLPEWNSEFRPDDLKENAIQVVGESDGVMNGGDYVLFYGKGPTDWTKPGGDYVHQTHLYSDSSYYFLRVNYQQGKRIPTVDESSLIPTHSYNYFEDYAVFEEEKVNLVKTGRRWFGAYYDIQTSYNVAFNFPHLVDTIPVKLTAQSAFRSTSPSTMNFLYRGNTVLNYTGATVTGNYASDYYKLKSGSASFLPETGDNIVLSTQFDKQGNPAAAAWMDYVKIQVGRELRMDNNPVFFRQSKGLGNGNVHAFTIANCNAQTQVWDLSTPWDVKRMQFSLNGTTAELTVSADSLREFVALKSSGFLIPTKARKQGNQNLHGLRDIQYLVVVPPQFKEAGEAIAEFHAEYSKYTTACVTTHEIYNEFSSGAQDLTALRDFFRHLYWNASDSVFRLQNVLLLGDASYDYKGRVSPNHNFIPIYEELLSNNLNNSTATDDYIALMDSSEGSPLLSVGLDIGVGRIPVTTSAQAWEAVAKIKSYAENLNKGPWRNKILLAADDVDIAWEKSLQFEADLNAQYLKNTYPQFNVDKVYMDAFQQVVTPGGQRYPEARSTIVRSVQEGVLIFNYIGHGGEVGLAQERVLELEDVVNWTNSDKLAVFVTATCEFTRVDDPDRISAGEYLILNKKGGAIASFSTIRAVGVGTAYSLNEAFYREAFARNGSLSFGEIIRNTKNRVPSGGNANFGLYGDPGLKFAWPKRRIITTSIQVDGQPGDTLKALSLVTISGKVEHAFGGVDVSFDGQLFPIIYDKATALKGLNNDNLSTDPAFYPEFNFELQKNILYKGRVSVDSGLFQFSFVVPKDIAYAIGSGKVSYYAASDSLDGSGADLSVLVGGSSSNASNDENGPEVQLFMNDEQFVNGGTTNQNPNLFAKVSDENGINTVGNGIGHDIVAVLDRESNEPIVLNAYYESDLDAYQSGTINYPFSTLEKGEHHLSLKVWDVHNNSSEAELDFIVADDGEMALEHVLNYPNPFTSYTEFHFEHNRPNEDLVVEVQIFTVSGQLVKTLRHQFFANGLRNTDVTWDGRDEFGDVLGKGVYIYRLQLKTADGKNKAEQYEKLVLLR